MAEQCQCHTVAILKVSETYDELINGLHDICKEAEDLEEVTIKDNTYKVHRELEVLKK